MTSTTLAKCLALALAFGFSVALGLFTRRLFAGWASDTAMGRGLCFSALTILLALILSPFMLVLIHTNGLGVNAWTTAYLMAGTCEEGARFITLLMLYRAMTTDDVREFVAGAAALGLGFGMLENFMYVASSNEIIELGALRGITAAPAHLAFAMVQACGMWAWKQRGASVWVAVAALGIAILMHGTYNFGQMVYSRDHALHLRLMTCGLLVSAIVIITIINLLVYAQFVNWADKCPRHDRKVNEVPGQNWYRFAYVLRYVAGTVMLGPLAVLYFKASEPELAIECAALIGAAASLALWSFAIQNVAEENGTGALKQI